RERLPCVPHIRPSGCRLQERLARRGRSRPAGAYPDALAGRSSDLADRAICRFGSTVASASRLAGAASAVPASSAVPRSLRRAGDTTVAQLPRYVPEQAVYPEAAAAQLGTRALHM